MHGKTCTVCDRGNCDLSERDFCDRCEEEFASTMATVRCADRTKVCTSPITCLSKKACVQANAAIQIYKAAPA